MNIITGYRGEAHITADQIRDENQGCFGDGSYILGVGSKLEATAVSATSVQLADGIISHQGCTASIPYGTTEAVTIGNGTQGMQRVDLIVARYTKDAGTGVEDMALAVIQGTPAASNPSTPSYNEGSIHAGDSPVDMPLYKVILDGISVDSVELVATVADSISELRASIDAVENYLGGITWKKTTASNITPSSTQNLAQLGAIDENGTYLVILCHPLLALEDTASVYVFRYANGVFNGRTAIYEGGANAALRLSTAAVLTQKASTTAYSTSIITAKIS